MKPREFWIDVSDEHDGDIPIAFREHPRQGPLQWQANLIHVIEFSAYQALEARHKKLLEALKFIVSKENIMFAECTDAEEILLKCKQAIEADAKAREYE